MYHFNSVDFWLKLFQSRNKNCLLHQPLNVVKTPFSKIIVLFLTYIFFPHNHYHEISKNCVRKQNERPMLALTESSGEQWHAQNCMASTREWKKQFLNLIFFHYQLNSRFFLRSNWWKNTKLYLKIAKKKCKNTTNEWCHSKIVS